MSVAVALDVDFVAYARSEYLAGQEWSEIAAELGVSVGQVADAMPRHWDGREWRTSILTPMQRAVARALSEGMGRREASDNLAILLHTLNVHLSQIRAAGFRFDVPPAEKTARSVVMAARRRPALLTETTRKGREMLLAGVATCDMKKALKLTPGAASGIAFRLRAEQRAERAAKSVAGESGGAGSPTVSLFTHRKGDGHGAQV